MLELHKKKNSLHPSAEREKIEREIAVPDEKIDEIVYELYGVVAAEGATKGIVVTTGYFTRDAEIFAHGKPLLLIRGNELSRLIEEGQKALISKSAKTSNRCP